MSLNFQKFGNGGKWYRTFLEKFLEISEAVEFPKWEPFVQKFYLEIPGAKMNGKKSSVKTFSKIGYTSRGCSHVLEVLKNTVPFATGSCRKFKVDVLVE